VGLSIIISKAQAQGPGSGHRRHITQRRVAVLGWKRATGPDPGDWPKSTSWSRVWSTNYCCVFEVRKTCVCCGCRRAHWSRTVGGNGGCPRTHYCPTGITSSCVCHPSTGRTPAFVERLARWNHAGSSPFKLSSQPESSGWTAVGPVVDSPAWIHRRNPATARTWKRFVVTLTTRLPVHRSWGWVDSGRVGSPTAFPRLGPCFDFSVRDKIRVRQNPWFWRKPQSRSLLRVPVAPFFSCRS